MLKTKIVSKSVKETQKIAELFSREAANFISPHALVVALEGELGSGKTTFAQGFSKALGIREKVLSPTFVLVKIYPIKKVKRFTPHLLSAGKFSRKAQPTKGAGFKHLVHVDCYRLNGAKDLLHLGLKSFLKDRDAIIVIEWADRVKKILPKDTIWIRFKHGPKSSIRILYI